MQMTEDLTYQLVTFAGTHCKKKGGGGVMCTMLRCVIMDVQIKYLTAAGHK